MIHSMTGYGKAEKEIGTKKITIEVKSLNSKQMDIYTRIPSMYKAKDIQVRKMISEKLVRGKVEFNLFYENLGEVSSTKINIPIVKNYFEQLTQLSNELNISLDASALQTLVQLPDALKTEHQELNEDEWIEIESLIGSALDEIADFRLQEGSALVKDIELNIRLIRDLIPVVENYEEDRIKTVRARLTEHIDELSKVEKFDANRFEQEMIYYIEKFDINEEKVRLRNHCDYFEKTLSAGGAVGKKLGFISQEIGREINTLGSKANHAEIQKNVILMKDSLEKIKEQVLNVL
ncbi:YicC family protein [Halosquirtibacter xylanolyticus]|uniref:YicC/YloC family endoribonuclease n=1 Tax=Halosquirtibacter xylanolyticus TaxID=3374599 RepID=UPI00374A2114|nr:YicC family protein [Prolixibacteraceae bacterium]